MKKRSRKVGQGAKWLRRSKRYAIYIRDGWACVYCLSDSALTIDHLVPAERGGSNCSTNLVTACLSCNSSRQHRTIRQWYRELRERGICTRKVSKRVRRLVRKPLDRDAGLGLAKSLRSQRVEEKFEKVLASCG